MGSGWWLVLLLPLMAATRRSSYSRNSASVPNSLISLDWMYRKIPPQPAVSESNQTVEELWVEQTLDHFSRFKPKKWKQRYFRNAASYTEGGPVFVFIFGQMEASPSWITGSYMADLVERHGAMALGLEHRYYGKSRPTGDASTANLHYLHSEQSLGDLANFIRQLRKQNETLDEAKWIVFGASYAGNLATWARMRYPDLIDGAVASSAFLLSKTDFEEYLEGVAMVASKHSEKCTSDVKAATDEFENLLSTNEGIDTINEIFSLCNELNTSAENDIAGFVVTIVEKFSSLVQPNPAGEGGRSEKDLCSALAESTETTPLLRLLKVIDFNDSFCFDPSFERIVEMFQVKSWNGNAVRAGARQWLYQSCTQFGNFPTTTSARQPFGHRLTLGYYTDLCTAVFGSKFTAENLEEAVNETNRLYGGLELNVNKVVFINGELDPWHHLSIVKDLNPSSPAILIKGATHCSDIYAPSADDSTQLLVAHKKMERKLNKWIRQ